MKVENKLKCKILANFLKTHSFVAHVYVLKTEEFIKYYLKLLKTHGSGGLYFHIWCTTVFALFPAFLTLPMNILFLLKIFTEIVISHYSRFFTSRSAFSPHFISVCWSVVNILST